MSVPEDGRRHVSTARDWTEDGAFRHSFLYLFDDEDAHRLQQAGVILAQAAIAGDPEYDPVEWTGPSATRCRTGERSAGWRRRSATC